MYRNHLRLEIANPYLETSDLIFSISDVKVLGEVCIP